MAHEVKTLPDHNAQHAATAIDQQKILDTRKNAQPGRWVAGWPIFPTWQSPGGGAAPVPIATTLATALNPLTQGDVDLFQYAVNAQQNSSNVTGGPGGGFKIGQAPWNNFLGTNTKPMFLMFPLGGGIYIGSLWDSVSGANGTYTDPITSNPINLMTSFYSALVECLLVTIQIGQQPTAYIPILSNPPGVRMDRRIATTADNTTLMTEGHGGLVPEGVREMPLTTYWDQQSQLQMVLTATTSLKFMIKQLTAQYLPTQGSEISWLGYGSEMRGVGVLM
jgi:hypothetical protein